MWKDFYFNEPYDGSFPEKINGAEYLTVIGDSLESLPEDINKYWKNIC